MNAFDPAELAADLLEVKRIFTTFFAARSAADWQRRTEKNGQGWTLRETVAHLDSASQAFQQAIAAAQSGRPCEVSGMVRRTDLPAWNQRQIEARASVPLPVICDSFLDTLQQAADLAADLPAAALDRYTLFPAYHRPITVGELLGAQASHPGIVHAAQVANGAGVSPLWLQFTPATWRRQLTRFFHLMSLAYWPERGGNLRARLTLSAGGAAGGNWHITLAPDGSHVVERHTQRPSLQLRFRSAHALCRTFTLQMSPVQAMLTAQLFARGSFRLGFRLGSLFNPV